MNKPDKKRVKERLIQEFDRVAEEVVRLSALTEAAESGEAFDGLDEVERMDAVLAKSNNDAALAAARTRLARLELTLERLDTDPEFGVCLECGENIGVKRLLAMPDATRCIRCAE